MYSTLKSDCPKTPPNLMAIIIFPNKILNWGEILHFQTHFFAICVPFSWSPQGHADECEKDPATSAPEVSLFHLGETMTPMTIPGQTFGGCHEPFFASTSDPCSYISDMGFYYLGSSLQWLCLSGNASSKPCVFRFLG